jgi:uncharacterized membrane protein YGL010W
MTTLEDYLAEYSESHTHPVNKTIHWVAVPVILFCVLGLLWIIPVPPSWQAITGLNFATMAMLASFVYYFRLSAKYAIGMLLVFGLMVGGIRLIESSPWPIFRVLIAAFIVAWIFQFIGHQIEGKRPSFLRDIQFLLIGPLWLLHKIYSIFESK